MSYAAVAAKGPKQSPEEVSHWRIGSSARAPAPPEVLHDDSSTASLIDVDSPHISSVPSSYSGETSTQQERQEREADEAARASKEKFDEVSRETGQEYEKAKQNTQEKGKEAKSKAKELGHEAEVKAKEAGQKAKEVGREAGKKAKEVGRDVERKVDQAAGEISENRDNPVVIGNAVIIGLGSLALGIGGWRKYKAGELDWQVGGLWAGAIGLFALGDYYLSQ
ncbi:hypothetical protein MMC30_002945 [Trapelia coarctata]|nr:hypothetical protein [Trapelia coarctata]